MVGARVVAGARGSAPRRLPGVVALYELAAACGQDLRLTLTPHDDADDRRPQERGWLIPPPSSSTTFASSPSTPSRSVGYARLAERALVYQLPERVLVADLADVIASKAAAGREKDLTRLPELRRLQQLRAAQHEGAGGEAPG